VGKEKHMTIQQTVRIDVHHHFVPPEYVAALARIGVTGAGGEDFRGWSPEQSLAMMDRQGIASSLLSLSAPGVFFGDRGLARDLARTTNEFAARMVSDNSHRFGFFATLALPDVDGAALELNYAMDTLHADGVILLSNYAGQYPGDPAFEPLFTELNRRKSVVFLHPTAATGAAVPQGSNAGATLAGIPSAMLEFVFDTTRAVTTLLAQGTLERTPNVRYIIPHAGGTVPYLALRVAAGAMWKAGTVTKGATWGPDMSQQERSAQLAQVITAMSQLQRLYYDTAFSDPASTFPSLLALVEPSQLLFGSDYPWAGEGLVSLVLKRLESYQGLDQQARRAIERDNALSLFPRFAASTSVSAG
jgi:6-methylsalicylate decarboxylase